MANGVTLFDPRSKLLPLEKEVIRLSNGQSMGQGECCVTVSSDGYFFGFSEEAGVIRVTDDNTVGSDRIRWVRYSKLSSRESGIFAGTIQGEGSKCIGFSRNGAEKNLGRDLVSNQIQ